LSAGQHCVASAVLLSVVAVVGLLVWPTHRSAAGPTAAFSFDEGSGPVVSDSSGNLNNGTAVNRTWVADRFGQALSFNGTNSLVTIVDSTLLTGMTVEACVKPSTTTGWRCVVLKESTNGLAYAFDGESNANRPAAYINTRGADIATSEADCSSDERMKPYCRNYDSSSVSV
jgi:hypothetical protein